MNLETISPKQLNDLEQQVRQLRLTIRKAKLDNDPMIEALERLERELELLRHKRFDMVYSEYSSY